MSRTEDGPLSANDVFDGIVFSRVTNLSQMRALFGQRDVGAALIGGDRYGTLSGARTSVKPFIVGFITPDVLVNFVPVKLSQVEEKTAAAAPKTSDEPVKDPKTLFIDHPPSFYAKLKQVADNIHANPEDLLACLTSESGLNAQATNFVRGKDGKVTNIPQALGLNQITPSAQKASGMTDSFWRNDYGKLTAEQQLPYVERYFKAVGHGRNFNNIGDLYMANAAPGFIGKSGDIVIYTGNAAKQNPGLDANKDGKITAGEINDFTGKAKNSGLYKSYLAAYKAAIASGAVPADGTAASKGPSIVSGGIMSNGVITDQETGDPLNAIGRNVQAADQDRIDISNAQVNELRDQILKAKSVPSLVLLVNPSKFTRSYEQTVDTVKVRRGYAVHIWNERPPSISCSGATAAQYAFRSDGEGGLTHFNRLHSASYKNLMSLVSMYRNNGHIFRGAPNQDPYNMGVPTISMSVFIYYDDKIYIGSFDDFSVTDDGEKPYNMSYSFKFTVRYEIDLPGSGLDRDFTTVQGLTTRS